MTNDSSSPIVINHSGGKFFVWGSECITILRKKHRICGQLVGSLPSKPWQSTSHSVPLLLLPCEAHFCEKNGIARIVDGKDYFAKRNVSTNSILEFNAKRSRIEKDQIKIFKTEKLEKEKLYYGMNKKSWKKKREVTSCDEVDGICFASGLDCGEDITQVQPQDIPNTQYQSKESAESNETVTTTGAEHVSIIASASVDTENNSNGIKSCTKESGSCDTNNIVNNDISLDTENNSNETENNSSDTKCCTKESGSCDTNNTVNNDISLDTENNSNDAKNCTTENVSCGTNNTENKDITWEDTVLSKEDLKYYNGSLRVHIPTDSVNEPSFELFHMSYPMTEKEKCCCIVYENIHRRGFYVTSGMKFGGDFLVYLGDPLRHHSQYIILVLERNHIFTVKDMITYGRLAAAVKKTVVLSTLNDDFSSVNYLSLTWAQMK